MKTIFRFIATTILLAVSYLSFGQSPQRHKIQDPLIFYRQLSIALTRETAALAYNVVADDDSFAATQLTSLDFTPALTFALKAQDMLLCRIGYMQYVEEVYDEFYKPEESSFQLLFFPIYIEYTMRASVDRRIPLERRMEYRGLDQEQKQSIAKEIWEIIVNLCVEKYLRPLLE